MPKDVVMPRLSDTMEEGTLLRWLKKPGDDIRRGDAIAEVETDKATMEVEAFDEGTLGDLLAQEGDRVPVGQPIARLNGAGEPAAQAGPEPEQAVEEKEKPAEKEPASPEENAIEEEAPEGQDIPEDGPHKLTNLTEWGGQPTLRSQERVLSPSRRREQRQGKADETPERAGEMKPAGERVNASPRARKLAEDHGVDLRKIQGSGPEGRIVEADVQAAVSRQGAGAEEQPSPEVSAEKPSHEKPSSERPSPERPSWMRETIARRMVQSKQEIPHFYITAVVRADDLVRLRKTLQRQFELSYNDLITKACALALRRHMRLNSSYRDGDIQPNRQVNIAMAVAVPEGLLTPVLHDADELSLEEIARQSREVAARARTDSLKPEDLTGGTFTISNMGMYKLESFTAIINPPHAGILAVAPIRAVPVVENGAVIPGYEMRLTLSADHRLVNGAEAAEFMGTLTHLLENPVLISETERSPSAR